MTASTRAPGIRIATLAALLTALALLGGRAHAAT